MYGVLGAREGYCVGITVRAEGIKKISMLARVEEAFHLFGLSLRQAVVYILEEAKWREKSMAEMSWVW